MSEKNIIRALRGEALSPPPIWMMRQAGRYLPEYRATRAQAGDFLSLCYNPELAEEVTLQPIRRYGFDASILFADILLVPQAMGMKLWFEPGEGPRLEPIETLAQAQALTVGDKIDETLSPIYQTVSRLTNSLPSETTLIGFAGSPWTVMTYMIAGRGTPDQAPARAMLKNEPKVFQAVLERVTLATIHYLSRQIEAGAEVIKLFDSWAGSLSGQDFVKAVIEPTEQIVLALRNKYPDTLFMGFPRGASEKEIVSYVEKTKVDGVAIGSEVDLNFAANTLQRLTCVQGNLDQSLLVSGGRQINEAVQRIVETLANGPHIFNLGHGITPDADPENVTRMIDAVRNG